MEGVEKGNYYPKRANTHINNKLIDDEKAKILLEMQVKGEITIWWLFSSAVKECREAVLI